jgi:hypothetical protein
MTHGEARDRLHRVASAVCELSAPAAVDRLLERLSTRDDGEELRAALVFVGARTVLEAADRLGRG